MRKFAWWVGAGLILLAVGPAMAQAGGGKGGGAAGKKGGIGRPGQPGPGRGPMARKAMTAAEAFDLMTAELDLSDEQKIQLLEKADSVKANVDKWEQDNAAALAQAKADLEAARTAKDLAKIRESATKLAELESQKDKLHQDKITEMVGLLSSEQKLQWETAKLNKEVTARLASADLTAEQKTTIRTMCQTTAGEMLTAQTDDAKLAARRQLQDNIVKNVLTDEQRGKLQAGRLGAQGGAGGKTAGPGAKAGGAKGNHGGKSPKGSQPSPAPAAEADQDD